MMRRRSMWLKGLVLLHWLISSLPFSTLAVLLLMSFRIAALMAGKFPAYEGYEAAGELAETLNDGLTHLLYAVGWHMLTLYFLAFASYPVIAAFMFYLQYCHTTHGKFKTAFTYTLVHLIVFALGFATLIFEPTRRIDWIFD